MRAFADIGGCPETLVPDNTKTGVSEANYWDPVLNRSYQALARHNEVAIVPARVRKPRDKATPMDPSIATTGTESLLTHCCREPDSNS